MARVFVDDTAAGTNAGTSWTNAYTSFASATSAAAGDEVRVRNTHAETVAANTTHNFSNGTTANPIKIISVAKGAADNGDNDTYSTGALIQDDGAGSYDFTLQGHVRVFGVTVTVDGGGSFISVAGSNNIFQEWTDCILTAGQQIFLSSINGRNRLINCTITAPFINGSGESTFEVVGGTITTSNGTYILTGSTELTAKFIGVDLSGCTGTKIIDSHETNQRIRATWDGCKLKAAWTFDPFTVPDSIINIRGCSSSTLSAPIRRITQFHSFEGDAYGDNTVTRNASDGTNAHTIKITTSTNSIERHGPLDISEWQLTKWVSTGSQTLTISVASDTNLTDEQFWIEVLSPSEAGSPTSQLQFNTTKPAIMTAAQNLSSRFGTSSGWGGTSKTYNLKVTVAITPAVAGPVFVRLFAAAAAGVSMWVDPIIEVS